MLRVLQCGSASGRAGAHVSLANVGLLGLLKSNVRVFVVAGFFIGDKLIRTLSAISATPFR